MMRRGLCAALQFLALLLCVSCLPGADAASALTESVEVVARRSRFDQSLAEQKLLPGQENGEGLAIARWVLPASLREVSGVALSPDGRLFAHGDEGGVVAVLDYRSGIMIKEFAVGKRSNSIDFEGITVAGEAIFMIVSNGDLYEFREGEPGQTVPYRIHRNALDKECEFEGVAYDAAIASLLLACKNVLNKEMRDSLVIFRWKLADTLSLVPPLTRLAIPIGNFTAPIQSKTMRPTDIAVDPVTGNYLLVAAQERALMEITSEGVVLFVRRLPAEHEQAEGLAVTKDGVIIISDEAVRGGATLTMYRKP